MAESPWRCSQCGTINEPVANSCRTCGRWPSLFDLQDSVVEDDAYALPQRDAGEPQAYVPDVYEHEPIQEPASLEPESFEPEPFEPEVADAPESEDQPERSSRRKWTSTIVPIALLVYFAISFFFNDR